MPSATRSTSSSDNSSSSSRIPSRRRILFSAVVEEFISNPSQLTESQLARYLPEGERELQNHSQLKRAPRCSIIATIVSDQASKAFSKPVLLFPLFSHLSLPIKPGEQVWVIYQSVGGKSGIGFWISRRVGPDIIDDLNYTHLDRAVETKAVEKASTSDRFTESTTNLKGKFSSGGGSRKSSQTLRGTDPYKNIIDNSFSYGQFTGEPVPNFTQRCADLVLLGSNNARVVLGENRVGPVENNPSETGSGTIDIVVGVGQTSSTNTATILNSRDYEEKDKSPENANIGEGDPDFFNDLARVYVSMSTSGDISFSTNGVSSLSTINPVNVNTGLGTASFESEDKSGPFVVAKSKHVRIVSHQKDSDGTIRVIQIDESGSEKASICIDKSGTIQIHGTNILMGSSEATQPYIRFNEFVQLVNKIAATFATHTAAVGAFGSACVIPVIGPMLAGPSALAAGAGSAASQAATLPTDALATASSKIYGE